MNGILIVKKESGMTSFDVVARVRRLFGTRQVGHTGTLDPMATGLLCVLVGRAVKASEYAVAHDKSYRAELTLGITTDTEDITGKPLSRSSSLPSASQVTEICREFVGKIKQIPPMYSAIKVGGEKLYDIARRGELVERKARDIEIYSLTCTPISEEEGRYTLDISCSSGTYVRTLCADIGKALGCGGVMSALERYSLGEFTLKDAHTLGELEEMSECERQALLIDTEALFKDLPIISLPPFFASLALSGNEIYLSKIKKDLPVGQRVRLYDESFFSLGEVREYEKGKAVKPIKKFRISE